MSAHARDGAKYRAIMGTLNRVRCLAVVHVTVYVNTGVMYREKTIGAKTMIRRRVPQILQTQTLAPNHGQLRL